MIFKSIFTVSTAIQAGLFVCTTLNLMTQLFQCFLEIKRIVDIKI